MNGRTLVHHRAISKQFRDLFLLAKLAPDALLRIPGSTTRGLGANHPNVNIEKLRKKVTGGFEPFAVCTSDGREYKVPHPEFIRLTARDVVVFESSGDGIMLDPLHIVSLRTYAQRQT